MGQVEIYNLLSESKEPLSTSEIAKILDMDVLKVSTTIRALLKYNEIQAVELDKVASKKFYRSKKKIRLYYI